MTSTVRAGTATSSRRRSVAGLVVALLLLPFLLGAESCFWFELKTPIGDPEQGWADPRISGVWLAESENIEPRDFCGWIWVFEPYDARTWLVTWAGFDDAGEPGPPAEQSGTPPKELPPPGPAQGPAKANGPRPALESADVLRIVETLGDARAKSNGTAIFKGWLTTLGGRRFLVLEPKAQLSSARRFQPETWLVFRAGLQDGRLLLSAFNSDMGTKDLVEATTRAKAEAIIARHAADPEFTTVIFTLHPVPRAAYDHAGKALERTINYK